MGMNDDPRGIVPYQVCRFCENISMISVYSSEEAEMVIELLRLTRGFTGQLFGEVEDAVLELRKKIQDNINSDDPLKYDME